MIDNDTTSHFSNVHQESDGLMLDTILKTFINLSFLKNHL